MPYTSPAAIVTGTTISKTTFGDVVKADLDFLANPPACRVYHNAAQSIANATVAALAFNSERFDTNTMHDVVTNNSRITINTAGIYLITGTLEFAANATGDRNLFIRADGATTLAVFDVPAVGGGRGTQLSIATAYKMAAGSYLEMCVFQNSGGALNVASGANYTPEFSAVWIGLG